MSNDDKTPDNKPPATTGNKNPFETFADNADSQNFLPLLKFNKGDWVVGRDAEPCPETELVAIVPGLMHGWIRWEDSFPVEHRMGLVMEGFVLPARDTLGYLDETTWEIDSKTGKPRDPFQESNYLPVMSINAENVYNFATSSDGGRRRAIAPLSREYGNHIRTNPDELPVIGLEQDSYMHPDRKIGRVKYPLFPVKKWVKADAYLAALTALTGKPLKLLLPA
jgi:hypothetical protein